MIFLVPGVLLFFLCPVVPGFLPVVPVFLPVVPGLVPGLLPLKFFGTGLSMFLTGSCPEVVPVVPGQSVLPVHFPVVPALRVFAFSLWRGSGSLHRKFATDISGAPEVPVLAPEVPAPRCPQRLVFGGGYK